MPKPPESSLVPALNHDQRVSLLVTYFLAFSGDFLRGLSAFTAPLLAAQLGATDEQVGLVASAYGFTYCFMPFLLGKLSDRIGRRKSINIAFWAYAVNSIIYIASTNLWILIGAAIMEGISLSFLWPSIGSLVVELSPESVKKRNVDHYMNSWNLGSLMGPLFAGVLYGIAGAQITFLGLTVISITCLILIRAFLVVERYVDNRADHQTINNDPKPIDPAPALKADAPQVRTHQKISPDNRKYLFYAFGMVLLSSIYMAILTSYYAGYAAKNSANSPLLIGITVFSFPLGRGIAFLLMDRVSLANKVNFIPIMTVVALIMTYCVTLTFEVGFLVMIFPILGFISGFAFCGGFAIITDLAPSRKGAFTGIAESIVGVAFFGGQYLPFLILGSSPLSPFWFAMIILIILAITFTFLRLSMPLRPYE